MSEIEVYILNILQKARQHFGADVKHSDLVDGSSLAGPGAPHDPLPLGQVGVSLRDPHQPHEEVVRLLQKEAKEGLWWLGALLQVLLRPEGAAFDTPASETQGSEKGNAERRVNGVRITVWQGVQCFVNVAPL